MSSNTPREPRQMNAQKVRRSPSRFLGQIAYAVRAEGKELTTACGRCGHEETTTMRSEFEAMKLLNWWSREHGGCGAFCKKCDGRTA